MQHEVQALAHETSSKKRFGFDALLNRRIGFGFDDSAEEELVPGPEALLESAVPFSQLADQPAGAGVESFKMKPSFAYAQRLCERLPGAAPRCAEMRREAPRGAEPRRRDATRHAQPRS